MAPTLRRGIVAPMFATGRAGGPWASGSDGGRARGRRGGGRACLVVAVQEEAGQGGMGAEGAAVIQGEAAAHSVAKRPGAVKQEATATRWRPRPARARRASGTVGAAAEA